MPATVRAQHTIVKLTKRAPHAHGLQRLCDKPYAHNGEPIERGRLQRAILAALASGRPVNHLA